MNNLEIGARIKLRREEMEKSLQDIADLTGLARSTIQRYETGQIKKIKLPVIESIARALNVRPDWVIGKTNEKYPESVPDIMAYYDQLNTTGKEAATEQVRLLTLDEKYTRPDNVETIVCEPDPDYLVLKAAHNDATIDDEELEKMNQDIELLKSLQKKRK